MRQSFQFCIRNKKGPANDAGPVQQGGVLMYTTAFSRFYIQLQEYKCELIVAGQDLVVVGPQFKRSGL